MKSTRRLIIERHADETLIRYQWCPTSVRYMIWLFLALALTILVSDHGGRDLTLRIAIELTWAAMVLGLVLVLAINSTEVRVTPAEVRVRCIPAGIYPERVLPRREIVSVHHWLHWRKTIYYRLSIQSAFPVYLGDFMTPAETRLAAEAIAERLQVDCSAGRPSQDIDFVALRNHLRIAAILAVPWVMLLLLTFFPL